ncbi:MAG: hypothetical protein FWC47_11890 [Oscillospiraceae bacterium]|nr:hypothetical protein [Oscillospiraceae bacterium]
MIDEVIDTKDLTEILFKLIQTEKVLVKEEDGAIQIVPINENADCTIDLK